MWGNVSDDIGEKMMALTVGQTSPLLNVAEGHFIRP